MGLSEPELGDEDVNVDDVLDVDDDTGRDVVHG